MADDWRRITVDADPEAFPCMQGYIQSEARIWWDLRFLYQAMHNCGEGRQKGDWLKWVKKALGHISLLEHVRIGGSDRVTNVISMKALVFFYARSIDVCWQPDFPAVASRLYTRHKGEAAAWGRDLQNQIRPSALYRVHRASSHAEPWGLLSCPPFGNRKCLHRAAW